MKTTILLLCSAFFLMGCFTAQPVAREVTENNEDYKVDYLFEHDGCKVYRFRDRGNYVYFTNCANEAITLTDSTQVINSITHRAK